MANNIRQQLAYQAAKVCMKKAKAFDLIKKLEIFIIFEDEKGYHLETCFDSTKLEKEEFDLLKEVLK